MNKKVVIAFMAAALPVCSDLPALAQQPAAQQARPGSLDIASIRRQAAQLAEVRAVLADPDPNIRLLAIREIARAGDPVQRQIAIEMGLASAESAMQEVAIRALMVNVIQIVFVINDADGKPATKGRSNYILTVSKFDADTGRIEGSTWNGQLQGVVFNFRASDSYIIIGRLIWDPEAGEFKGNINFHNGDADEDRRATWRPR